MNDGQRVCAVRRASARVLGTVSPSCSYKQTASKRDLSLCVRHWTRQLSTPGSLSCTQRKACHCPHFKTTLSSRTFSPSCTEHRATGRAQVATMPGSWTSSSTMTATLQRTRPYWAWNRPFSAASTAIRASSALPDPTTSKRCVASSSSWRRPPGWSGGAYRGSRVSEAARSWACTR
jgi:hypothetical protein